jgi:transcription elongation factor GreA
MTTQPLKVHFTKEGYNELQQELKTLKNNKQPQAIERVARARDFGDLTENSEYHSARDDLAFIEGRIQEIESLLSRVEIIKKRTTNQVALGCKVTVQNDSKTTTFIVVGEWEADPAKQKISHESPLGKALLGKKVGDQVEFEAPAGKIIYKIKKIH